MTVGVFQESVPQILNQGNFDHIIKPLHLFKSFPNRQWNKIVSPVSKESQNWHKSFLMVVSSEVLLLLPVI